MNNPYVYKIKEFSNYDGDSFDLSLDLGFDLVLHEKCRIYGVDTPELRGGTDRSKRAGYLARDFARDLVSLWMQEGGAFFVSENYAGKFGRPLGDIQDAEGRSLRTSLIANNLGVEYHGGSKAAIEFAHEGNFLVLEAEGKI